MDNSHDSNKPVAWMHTMIEDVVVGHRPADLNVHPDRWMPLYKDPTPCQTCEALARTVMMDQTAHDTAPPAQPAPVQLTDGVTVPLAVLEAAEASLGSFCSDHGWSDEDMQNMDNLSAYIARHKANLGITKGQP